MWQRVLGAEAPPTVIVGHSMGGAVAVWAASLKARNLLGTCLLPSFPNRQGTPLRAALAMQLGSHSGWVNGHEASVPDTMYEKATTEHPAGLHCCRKVAHEWCRRLTNAWSAGWRLQRQPPIAAQDCPCACMPQADACMLLQAVPSLEGLVVLDVVEGTALACLPHMSAVLSRRPPSFPSLRVALEWAQHSGAPLFKLAGVQSLSSWRCACCLRTSSYGLSRDTPVPGALRAC